MLKNVGAAVGAKVADIIKKDDFWDEIENIVRMSQLVDGCSRRLHSHLGNLVCSRSCTVLDVRSNTAFNQCFSGQ